MAKEGNQGTSFWPTGQMENVLKSVPKIQSIAMPSSGFGAPIYNTWIIRKIPS